MDKIITSMMQTWLNTTAGQDVLKNIKSIALDFEQIRIENSEILNLLRKANETKQLEHEKHD